MSKPTRDDQLFDTEEDNPTKEGLVSLESSGMPKPPTNYEKCVLCKSDISENCRNMYFLEIKPPEAHPNIEEVLTK